MAIKQRHAALAVFGLGGVFLMCGIAHWWLGERAFARMRDTTCTVVSRKIETNLLVSPGGRRRRPGGARYREEAHLVFAHTLGGQRHSFSEDFVYDWGRYSHCLLYTSPSPRD